MQRKNERFVERLPLLPDRPWVAYGVAALLSVLALIVRLSVSDVLPAGYPFVTFFPAVIITSFVFGVRPGIFTAFLCGLFSWYAFIPPTWTLKIQFNTVVALAFYTFVCVTDIVLVSWMQRANYKLGVERERNRALAENREMLFRELQHRVSNNIQVVAALLALQRRGVSDDAARKALDEASQRLTLIGKIGRALYDPDGQQLGVHTFVRTLATDILEASGRKDIAVDIQVDESITVQPDAAVPLSLILAEAINNAVEHGFAGREAGTISIALRRSDGDRIVLDVSDDGHGLPPGYVQDNSGSLGLRIASALAQQLGGTFALEQRDAGGVRARLDIPA